MILGLPLVVYSVFVSRLFVIGKSYLLLASTGYRIKSVMHLDAKLK